VVKVLDFESWVPWFEPQPARSLCCVLRKDTLLRFPLSTQEYKWVPDPVQDWGRQRQRGRGDGCRPHYAGPVKSEMLHISLTYDRLVMVIPLPLPYKSASFFFSRKSVHKFEQNIFHLYFYYMVLFIRDGHTHAICLF